MAKPQRNFEMEAARAALQASALVIFMFYRKQAEDDFETMSKAEQATATDELVRQAVTAAFRGLPKDHPLQEHIADIENDLQALARKRPRRSTN